MDRNGPDEAKLPPTEGQGLTLLAQGQHEDRSFLKSLGHVPGGFAKHLEVLKIRLPDPVGREQTEVDDVDSVLAIEVAKGPATRSVNSGRQRTEVHDVNDKVQVSITKTRADDDLHQRTYVLLIHGVVAIEVANLKRQRTAVANNLVDMAAIDVPDPSTLPSTTFKQNMKSPPSWPSPQTVLTVLIHSPSRALGGVSVTN